MEQAAGQLETGPEARHSAPDDAPKGLLVGAQQVAPALRYAVGVVGGPLRLKDRSWWKLLHTLECEGLTPRTEPRLDLDLTPWSRSLP